MAAFHPVDFILRKRNGQAHTPDAIRTFVDAYTQGTLPDYQVSAWLMAAFLNGLDADETYALTHAMLHSGTVVDLSGLPGRKVDKHSTGGVGDKVSILLAPLVAACGVPVPMISGRSLGHTGGTLDKLEAIPGFRTDLDLASYHRLLADLGVVMIGQTDEIAPADRKLYALRDVTGTVECIPLIAGSIMSKKLAEGIDALVLDVKVGRGAFMQDEAQARRLAETLVGLGEQFGKRTVALLTGMDVPLGRGIGNWPETAEAIRCLQGEEVPDLLEVTLALAGEMLCLGGRTETPAEGVEEARRVLASGAAFDRFVALVEAQGGDPAVLHDVSAREGAAPVAEVRAPDHARGYVATLNPRELGRLAMQMGAGRLRKEDPVDPTAGITLNKKPGDPVEPGAVLAYLHTQRRQDLDAYTVALQAAYTYTEAAPNVPDRLRDRFADGQWHGM